MSVLSSFVDPQSDTFQQNRAEMLSLLEGVRSVEAKVRANSERQRSRFEAAGQLLPRDRIDALLDAEAPWLEISTVVSAFGLPSS